MSEEVIRLLILDIVLAVLILRTPWVILDRQQRPVWLMIAVFVCGSVVIQSGFATAINQVSAITQFNNLIQTLWNVFSMAVTLEFVAHLVGYRHRFWQCRAAWIGWSLITAVGMSVCFALTKPAERFARSAASVPPVFAAYSLLYAAYIASSAATITWVMCRHLPLVQGRVLFTGLLMMAVGDATQIPFVTIRTLERMTGSISLELSQTAFMLSATRFVLFPLGCVLVAAEPVHKAATYWYRRARVYPLWVLLRSCPPALMSTPPSFVSRWWDLMMVDHVWERLHRRVIEIRDSIVYLYDAFAWPGLIDRATRYAQAVALPEERRIVALACWLEVTRRLANSGTSVSRPRLDQPPFLPLHTDGTTTYMESRDLARLYRALRSREVQMFADTVLREQSVTVTCRPT